MLFDDDTGLFWQTEHYVRRGQGNVDPIEALKKRLLNSSFNDTYNVPELKNPPPGIMAFDVETDDPDLMARGSSWAFGRGEIIGFSVAWENFNGYYPIRHISGNVDSQPPLSWLRDQGKRTDLKFVCANAGYDMGWFRQEFGFYPRGGCTDIQHMAAILDEYRLHYSLESISQDYLGVGKETSRLEQLEKQFGCKHVHFMGCLKWLPGPVLGEYAEKDATRTFQVYQKLLPLIENQGLSTVLSLESKLIPMCCEMRRIGIKVNIDKTEALSNDIKTRRMPELVAKIKDQTGIEVSPWESDSCYEALKIIGWNNFKKNRDGSWSIKNDLLAKIAEIHPVGQNLLDLRKMSKISGTFLEGHILDNQENGRIHTEFNQLRSERDEDGSGFGTVTGRFSCLLHNLPVRDPEWGPIVRGLFEPDGEEFVSEDYSGQEPRFAVHFAYKAKIKGADLAVEQYKKDPNTKYHQYVADLANISYSKAKTINLGLGYGMGQAKLARSLGLPTQWKKIEWRYGKQVWSNIEPWQVDDYRKQDIQCVEVAGEEARKILTKWEQGAPFVKGLYKHAKEIADERGFVTTILRRRCRFPSIAGERQGTHKAMNRICQSSSADQMKQGMAILWDEKIIPQLTIHDELLKSISDRKVAERMKEIMEHTIELVIPTVVDVKYGANWGLIPK